MQPIDDATSAFLRSAADDLHRQLGLAAAVDELTIEQLPHGVTLVAALRIVTAAWPSGAVAQIS